MEIQELYRSNAPSAHMPVSVNANRINVLIVDDEPANLTVLEAILDDPAYRLVRAESADQALLALVVDEFALIILDVRMPGMTGFELAKMIKQRKKNARVPIIFLTAYYNEDQHTIEGYESGAADYLHKPVNAAILRSKVAVFAELHHKRLELEVANEALVCEIAGRTEAEEKLRELNETLENSVRARTTDLYNSELQLRAIYDTAQEHLGLVASDGRLLETNRASLELVGCSREEVVGMPFWDTPWFVSTPGAPAVVRDAIGRAACGELVRYDSLTITLDGKARTFEFSFYPIRNDAGEVIYIVPTAFDVTERNLLLLRLQDADRRKDEFLAILAHELRNPLVPIQNAIHLMQMKEPTRATTEWAREVIDRQVRNLIRLIDDLMDIGRINRGKMELNLELVEFNGIIEAALEASRPNIDRHRHRLIVSLPETPALVNADRTRMAQVFWNLLNNAAKFMTPEGLIELRAEAAGSVLMVSVKDQGVGIEDEKIPALFEMFSQSQGALSRSEGGLGIGLFLVKQLVELHGGSVEARSRGRGQGSEFIVRIPLALTQTFGSRASGASATLQRELRILVVDDNRDAATSMSRVLEIMGNHIRVAHDGEEAIRLAGEFRPQVILLDIGLPLVNGYDVARAIRRESWGRDICLVAITGWGQPEFRRQSEEAGFDQHLVKPVDLRAVAEKWAQWIAARTGRRGSYE